MDISYCFAVLGWCNIAISCPLFVVARNWIGATTRRTDETVLDVKEATKKVQALNSLGVVILQIDKQLLIH